jgi:group I intron endonuclease
VIEFINKEYWKDKSGVYFIMSTIDARTYVGHTLRKLGKRDVEHSQELKRKDHGNYILQNFYNKYGEKCLVFKPMIETYDLETALAEEQKFIDFFKKNKISFNINPTARSCKGKKLTDEHKEKLRLSRTGTKASEEARKNLSIAHMGKKLSQASIEKGRLKRIGQKRSLETRKRISEAGKGRPMTLESRKKSMVSQPTSKKVYQYSLQGDYITTYLSIHDAGRLTGIPFPNISFVCSSEEGRRQAGGFKWSYNYKEKLDEV